MPTARSFCTQLTGAEGLTRSLGAVRGEVTTPSGGIVFVAGAAPQDLGAIVDRVRSAWRGVPIVVVPAAGVLSERAEIEGAPAVSGVLWSGGRVSPVSIAEASSPTSLRDTLANTVGDRPATVLLFPRSDFSPDVLEGIAGVAPNACIFGAGTVGGAAIVITATGEILRGRMSGLVLHGLAQPIVDASAACRLLTPFRRIEETAGGLVLRLEGTSALDALSTSAADLRGSGSDGAQPVVFAALAEDEGERWVVRPVRGIDPVRRGIMIGPEAKPGARLAFAVRDAAAGKAGLDAAAKGVAQKALGAAPRFAIYLSCAGRGQGLYGAPEVEARLLRQRFGDLPIAGMHSAFEITPWGQGAAKLALYTGVLALFRAPS